MGAPVTRRSGCVAQAALSLAAGAGAPVAYADAVPSAPPPAYQLAAREAGVPAAVLYAVALQESGTHFRGHLVPWPWTLNVAGRAQRYATRADACAGLRRAMVTTVLRKIDVGLGQVNLGYQAQRYSHPCQLIDPYRNLAVSA